MLIILFIKNVAMILTKRGKCYLCHGFRFCLD